MEMKKLRPLLPLLTGSVVLIVLSSHGSGLNSGAISDQGSIYMLPENPDPVRAPGNPLDQGGETCASATVIPGLPFTGSGTTAGYANDYDYACPYAYSVAPDVVYSYTPWVDEFATFSLCLGPTVYDTKLYIYAGACVNPPIACNDDACSSPQFANYVSRLDCVPLTAGTTYYVIVDGYGSEFGNYTLDIFGCEMWCLTECPPGSVQENEPVCHDEYLDNYNGGCVMHDYHALRDCNASGVLRRPCLSDQ
jgi:hypothetical protein